MIRLLRAAAVWPLVGGLALLALISPHYRITLMLADAAERLAGG